MRLFNKQSKWTFEDFEKSDAFRLMRDVKLNFWIYSENMTEEDKENHPEHETTGGYLKNISYKDAFQNAWGNWSEESRDAFRELPNFNAKIFEEITGVKTNKNLKPTK